MVLGVPIFKHFRVTTVGSESGIFISSDFGYKV